MSGVERAVQICAFCPGLCRFACPVEEAEGREAASPRFMVALRHHLEVGLLDWSQDVADALTYCDGCGACTEVCEHSNPVHDLLIEARREAKNRDLVPAAYGRIAENLAAGLGPAGRFLDRPLREVHPERAGSAGDLLIWPSDRALEEGPESLERLCTFLDLLGIEYCLPSPEVYGPSPRWAREIGARSLQQDLRKKLKRAVAGFQRVLFEDPADRAVLKKGPQALAAWDLAPPQGFRLLVETRYTFAPRRPDADFGDLGRALGLQALTGPGDLQLGAGGAGLFDLVHPELAGRLRDRITARAGGAGVLVPDPFLASWLEQGGARTRSLAALRPRELA